MEPHPDRATAERLIERLRGFAATLDGEERALFGALIAPGVAQAYTPDEPAGDDEVIGFGQVDASEDGSEVMWSPAALPNALLEVIRDHDVRVSGLTP